MTGANFNKHWWTFQVWWSRPLWELGLNFPSDEVSALDLSSTNQTALGFGALLVSSKVYSTEILWTFVSGAPFKQWLWDFWVSSNELVLCSSTEMLLLFCNCWVCTFTIIIRIRIFMIDLLGLNTDLNEEGVLICDWLILHSMYRLFLNNLILQTDAICLVTSWNFINLIPLSGQICSDAFSSEELRLQRSIVSLSSLTVSVTIVARLLCCASWDTVTFVEVSCSKP